MNIFVLASDPVQAAQYHHDAHVVKMILESAQILSSAVARHGGPTIYKPAYTKHPCTVWAGDTKANWVWLKRLALALCGEFSMRFDKVHSSERVIRALESRWLPPGELTEFAQAMPDQYKVPGHAVAAYRSYYIGEKLTITRADTTRSVTWKGRAIPPFLKDHLTG